MCDVSVGHPWGAFDTVALLGGFVIAGALVPGLIRTVSRREYGGISYTWQFVYMVGLAAIAAYAVHYELWAILIPEVVELSELLLLTLMKLHYDLTVPPPDENLPISKASVSSELLPPESAKRAGIRRVRFGRRSSSSSFDRSQPAEPPLESPVAAPPADVECANEPQEGVQGGQRQEGSAGGS